MGQYVNDKYEVLVNEADIAWPNAAKSAPQAEPECGFTGENCGKCQEVYVATISAKIRCIEYFHRELLLT